MANSREETARARAARTLEEEILNQDTVGIFPIESECELCRRFKISRVTVRLALGDLEARGLIFRRHGKGTFAFGRPKRVQRSLGVLLRKPPTQGQWPITELLRGFQFGAAAMQVDVLLLNTSPEEWTAGVIKELGGIFLIPSGLTCKEVGFLQQMKLPLLLGWESNLPGSHVDFGQVDSARVITERLLMAGHEQIAFIGGFEESLDELKKTGIYQALESVGKSSNDLIELVLPSDDGLAEELFSDLISGKPRLTAVITADDGIAGRFAQFLSSQQKLQIPAVMSIASFHRYPFPACTQKPLSTVSFDFFKAGKLAAESLAQAAMTGEAPANVLLPGALVDGATIGGRSVLAHQEPAKSAS